MIKNSENIVREILRNDLFDRKQVSLSVLRLDKIHPIISGNKLFKLHYFMEEALSSKHKTIITFGGAYSNHLSATAYACKISGLQCIGFVRGEKPTHLSHTLKQCAADGMDLHFISRELYNKKDTILFTEQLQEKFGEHILIPEGGYHNLGAKGASLIMDLIPDNSITHICSAFGTTTTIAGLLLGCKPHQQIIGVSALKGMTDVENTVSLITHAPVKTGQLKIVDNYHFGGYAKMNTELIAFMNDLYRQYQLPTDFVYTAKMMYAVLDAIKNDEFAPGASVVCIHTGGLQGNLSLPANTLNF